MCPHLRKISQIFNRARRRSVRLDDENLIRVINKPGTRNQWIISKRNADPPRYVPTLTSWTFEDLEYLVLSFNPFTKIRRKSLKVKRYILVDCHCRCRQGCRDVVGHTNGLNY